MLRSSAGSSYWKAVRRLLDIQDPLELTANREFDGAPKQVGCSAQMMDYLQHLKGIGSARMHEHTECKPDVIVHLLLARQ